jgi:protease YdgD
MRGIGRIPRSAPITGRRAAFAAAVLLLLAMPRAMASDRRVVVDPDRPPWSAIARVQTNIGTRCTGVLIAPSVVLTAAHCLYNPRTRALLQPLSLHVMFGYARGQYRFHRLVAQVATGGGFDGRRGPAQPVDWARLRLAEAVPLPALPLYAGDRTPGMAAVLAGYNQDRAELLMADLACHVRRVAPLPGGAAFLLDDCAGTRGTSGAPLLVRQGQGWAVLGIAIAAGRQANLALAPPPAHGR